LAYEVLARKYRPRRFADLVGQQHVVKPLVNALEADRLHHAYLFTGTRGVGKTTIARILVRCLNCEGGVTSVPCGTCTVCNDISLGRFVDLLEFDAASHTGVDDIRDVLEDVPCAPVYGRFKVYLIDEVHMLSRSSFNALLKTLEEPPEHVKFLLATTDPRQIPVTVLSRCLQFNLRALVPAVISKYLLSLLDKIEIPADRQAVTLVAHAANGSMRDALSLVDQAVAFGDGAVELESVQQMLGTLDHRLLHALMDKLLAGDGLGVLAVADECLRQTFDVDRLLSDLATLMHYVSLTQLDPGALPDELPDTDFYLKIAKNISPQVAQLYYQALLIGRRDLPVAPSARVALEMTLLRMLTFVRIMPSTPAIRECRQQDIHHPTTNRGSGNFAGQHSHASRQTSVMDTEKEPDVVADSRPGEAATATQSHLTVEERLEILDSLSIDGLARQLLDNCEPVTWLDEQITLVLDEKFSALSSAIKGQRPLIAEALSAELRRETVVHIEVGQVRQTRAMSIRASERERRTIAEESLGNDRMVKHILDRFDASITTIRPASAECAD